MPLERRSVVASWDVTIPEGKFLIEFEHGTTSGKRVIWINGQEIFRKDWMFRLVGSEVFNVGHYQCKLDVEPDGAFGLNYVLFIDGQIFEQFLESYKKKHITWTVDLCNGKTHTFVLEKDTRDVWLDGKKVETTVQFMDGGSFLEFTIDDSPVVIKSLSSGNKKQGMIHQINIGDKVLDPNE